MTAKKKTKSAEVEGLVVKIDVDMSGVNEATAALRELADAANAAREALDRLRGETVINIAAPQTHSENSSLDAIMDTIFPGSPGAGFRPSGKKFKL